MDTEEKPIPEKPAKKKNTLNAEFLKKYQHIISLLNVFLTASLIGITLYFYINSTNLNTAQFLLSQQQYKDRHKKDTADEKQQAIQNSNQTRTLNALIKQADAATDQLMLQKKVVDIELYSTHPLISLNSLNYDTTRRNDGLWLSIINKGGRNVQIRRIRVNVYNIGYDYYTVFKNTGLKNIDPNYSLTIGVPDIPTPILGDPTTLYHTNILVDDFLTDTSYTTDNYFKAPYNTPTGLRFSYLGDDELNRFKKVERNYKPPKKDRFYASQMGTFPRGIAIDTIDASWVINVKSETMRMFMGNVSRMPLITDANYLPINPTNGGNLNQGTLSFYNISTIYPISVIIDGKLSRRIADKINWIPPDFIDDGGEPEPLESGYHTIKLVYAFNPEKYFKYAVVKIIRSKELRVSIK